MSQIQTIGAGSEARAAIARAAKATGVDFDYLLAQAKLESSLDPLARSGTSSAAGLYQFVGGTWLDTLEKHGAEHGLGWAGAASRDPAMRGSVMALRYDPDASAMMAAELANDNKLALTATLGRAPDAAELYLAHFLGNEGATRFLSGLANDPGQSAASLLPTAAAANRAIFFDPTGAPRSLGEVMELLRGKLGAAMEGGDAAQWAAAPAASQPGERSAPHVEQAEAATPPARPSMAETLRQTFALESADIAPSHVRAAYAQLSALGL